jgi:hypothetical protein
MAGVAQWQFWTLHCNEACEPARFRWAWSLLGLTLAVTLAAAGWASRRGGSVLRLVGTLAVITAIAVVAYALFGP